MKKKKSKKQLNKYARFSGIGIQMCITIYLGNIFGKWLDSYFTNYNYTKIFTLIAIFISIFSVILQVLKMSKNND